MNFCVAKFALSVLVYCTPNSSTGTTSYTFIYSTKTITTIAPPLYRPKSRMQYYSLGTLHKGPQSAVELFTIQPAFSLTHLCRFCAFKTFFAPKHKDLFRERCVLACGTSQTP